MADLQHFNLPDVGEGLTEAEVVSWKVTPGDAVKVNDVLVEIETAKSLVELPSPYAGIVAELLVPEGRTVDVGTPIIAIARTGAAVTTPVETPAAAPAPVAGASASANGSAGAGRTAVLVGYGPREVEVKRRPRRSAEPEPAPRRTTPVAAPASRGVLAKPPVRKLAKSLGVELHSVVPTGAGGIVTREDVEAAAGGRRSALASASTDVLPRPASGGETRVPVRGVRKATAQAMVRSAFTAPHVTVWVTADVTRSMDLVERLGKHRDFTGRRVSPLLLVMKALLLAIRRFPEINASWDDSTQEIVVHHDVNLGIAAATPRGLLVPHIKNAGALALPELADALSELARTAREGKTPPSAMIGGTITITNVGVFGVDGGTPILNPGEAAILCLGAVQDKPWVVGGEVVARKVVELTLSFDHRLIDGELGSRFLSDVAAMMTDPDLMLIR